MRYLLDTNAISDVIELPTGPAAGHIRRLSETAEIVTSIVVVAELRYGYTKISSSRLKTAYEAFFESIAVENWEAPFDNVYADIRSALEKMGRTLGAMDMLIAAHALATDAAVVTRDKAFLHVRGLTIENWSRDEARHEGE